MQNETSADVAFDTSCLLNHEVLRHVADADKGEVFSVLIGGPEGHGTGKMRVW